MSKNFEFGPCDDSHDDSEDLMTQSKSNPAAADGLEAQCKKVMEDLHVPHLYSGIDLTTYDNMAANAFAAFIRARELALRQALQAAQIRVHFNEHNDQVAWLLCKAPSCVEMREMVGLAGAARPEQGGEQNMSTKQGREGKC